MGPSEDDAGGGAGEDVPPRRLFGTNGIRGIVNETMTVELAQGLGAAVAGLLGAGSRACIGRDVRLSSPALAAALSSGLTFGGVDVTDLGLVPTPVVHHAVVEGGFDAGLVVTASHNPPEWNGIKVVAADGTELPPAQEAEVERRYFEDDLPAVGWDRVGSIRRDARAAERYVDAVLSHVDADLVRDAGLEVVLDVGNGAGAVTAPDALSRLGVRCVALNAQPDGRFPGHPSEPTPEHLQDLAATVPARGADLGAAQDGDADRCVFVDETGGFVPGERMLALMAADAVRRNGGEGLVVTPVSTSLAVQEMVEAAGGQVRYTAVGSPIVARAMRDTGAVFGGEENGGFVFPAHQHCRDALMTLVAGIELVAREGRPLSELLAEVPAFSTVKRKVPCPEAKKAEVMEALGRKVLDDHGDVDTTDGVKVWLEDGWVLVRPSGTEALMRVFAEARDEDRAEALADAWTEEVRALAGVTE